MADSRKIVAVTGATGFVGRHVIEKLVEKDCEIRVLIRDPGKLRANADKVTPIVGNVFDNSALDDLVSNADCVIHLVGIIEENKSAGQTFERVHTQATKNLIAAAQKAGVKRWVHMSALGSRANAVAPYHQSKWAAEEALRASDLDWTIFRPSIIHGPDGEFMQMVQSFHCERFNPPLFRPGFPNPFKLVYYVPYFGAGLLGCGGAGQLQPVWVEDVATCFVEAIDNEKTIKQIYPLGGPDRLTWPELYRITGELTPGAIGKKPAAVPAWYAKLIAPLPFVPFNYDQVVMSQEQSICEITKVQDDLGIELAPFESTYASYAQSIASHGPR